MYAILFDFGENINYSACIEAIVKRKIRLSVEKRYIPV